jgi:hypothetical protein
MMHREIIAVCSDIYTKRMGRTLKFFYESWWNLKQIGILGFRGLKKWD